MNIYLPESIEANDPDELTFHESCKTINLRRMTLESFIETANS
jgi:hypothetical protein